jgi:isopentenyl-diphosphate delta-isomerase
MLHETVKAAAKRRLLYELGIKDVDLKVVLPNFRYRAEKDGVVENEICPVLVGRFTGMPKPNPEEVNDVRWVDWATFVAEVAEPENGYSPWAKEEAELLARNGTDVPSIG